MRTSSIKRFATGFLIIVLYILYHLYLYADVGSTSAEFLIVPVGSRPAAMAGAFVGVSDDINSAAYNPAGLGNLKKKQISFMHSNWIIDTTYDYGAYIHPTTAGTLGLTVRYVNAGDLTGRDNLGNKTSDFTATDLAISFLYGKSISEVMSIGFAGTYINQKIDDADRSGSSVDVGFLWKCIPDKFFIGSSIQNAGPKLEAFDTEQETLPTVFRIGVGYYGREKKLLLASDIKQIIHGKPSWCTGIEYSLVKLFKLRSGFEAGSDKDKSLMWTAGMGFAIKNYALDYAYEVFGELDATHRFTLTAKW